MPRTLKTMLSSKKEKMPLFNYKTKTTLKNKIMEFLVNEDQKKSVQLKKIFIIGFVFAATTSCVSTKKLALEQDKSKRMSQSWNDCEKKYDNLNKDNHDLSGKIIKLENQLANEQNKYNLLEQQLEYFKLTNTNLLDRLSDLAIVSKTGAESIKKSLEAINGQNVYIKDLTSAMRQKDSLNLALVMNLKKSLIDISDDDINIEVKKGVVYISISDKLLFKSGSSEISPKAEEVLGKIARVLNDQKQLDILVEGHTDNVPIASACITDNWDLSVKRATTVVRYLQSKHNINPERMTAGGRSEFVPKASNATAEGKAINRRTEIIVLPQLDQFFQLLEPPTN